MATETYFISGKCKWAKVYKPDEIYGKYSIDLQLSDEELKTFKSIGLKNTVKEGNWITLRRDPEHTVYIKGEPVKAGAPMVLDADGKPMRELVGNGSEVTVKITVYSYNNKFGKGRGSRLESVRVDKLEKYEGGPAASGPAKASGESSASPSPRRGGLF